LICQAAGGVEGGLGCGRKGRGSRGRWRVGLERPLCGCTCMTDEE